MELVGIENSKVIHLTQLYRPAGQLIQADAVIKLAQRYGFADVPSLKEIAQNERSFKLGAFDGVQISEMSIYSDGFIASSASNTNIIERFMDDLLHWAKKEFGLITPPGVEEERSFESYLVVQTETDLMKALKPRNDLAALVNEIFKPDRYTGTGLWLTGFLLAPDNPAFPARRKPINLMIDRRLGQPFEKNLFFAQGPLRTNDLLAFLNAVEELASAD